MAAFLALGIETVDVAGHFHELGRGEIVQVFEDGFDYAHFSSS
jgi:hypothetical protein